jgi:hypothetical protein
MEKIMNEKLERIKKAAEEFNAALLDVKLAVCPSYFGINFLRQVPTVNWVLLNSEFEEAIQRELKAKKIAEKLTPEELNFLENNVSCFHGKMRGTASHGYQWAEYEAESMKGDKTKSDPEICT